ncbi:hypothetical protein LINGRAHAP2_LOCUS13386 [Linum grandiflorum]
MFQNPIKRRNRSIFGHWTYTSSQTRSNQDVCCRLSGVTIDHRCFCCQEGVIWDMEIVFCETYFVIKVGLFGRDHF